MPFYEKYKIALQAKFVKFKVKHFVEIPTICHDKTLLYRLFFYGWGSTASRLQPLQGGSLLFTIQFPEISGTHFIDLRRMKG